MAGPASFEVIVAKLASCSGWSAADGVPDRGRVIRELFYHAGVCAAWATSVNPLWRLTDLSAWNLRAVRGSGIRD
jgi:hypothetical protein